MDNPKARILNTAFLLFHQQGYNSTGINQIIQDARVAKASFYQHFKSKDDLCIAFLTARHDFWFSELRNYTQNAVSQKEFMATTFDFIVYMNEMEDFRGCSFLNILAEIPNDNMKILKVIQEHKKDLRDYFSSLVSDENIAEHIYLLFESSIMESKMFKSNQLIERSKMIVDHLV